MSFWIAHTPEGSLLIDLTENTLNPIPGTTLLSRALANGRVHATKVDGEWFIKGQPVDLKTHALIERTPEIQADDA